MLVGGLSRGVRGGQTRRPVGSGVSHLLTCYKTQEQHDVYVYVGLCICRSVTPNSGVKSEKHFHLEIFPPTNQMFSADTCTHADRSFFCRFGAAY